MKISCLISQFKVSVHITVPVSLLKANFSCYCKACHYFEKEHLTEDTEDYYHYSQHKKTSQGQPKYSDEVFKTSTWVQNVPNLRQTEMIY